MGHGKRAMAGAVVALMIGCVSLCGDGLRAAAAPMPGQQAHIASSAYRNSIAEIVVLNFYDAINTGDFEYAYALLGRSWRAGQSYDSFVQGFAATAWDDVTVLATTEGRTSSTVTIALDAYQKDGSVRYYRGTYTVGYEGGIHRILSGTLRQL